MQQIPVYVINLDRRPDRWAVMSEQLDRLGIEAERVPAVDARLLAKQEAWEAETNGNPPMFSRHVYIGGAACCLSHCAALGTFLETDHPVALILEDDAELASDTIGLLHSADWWPSAARVVRLEAAGGASESWRDEAPLWGVSGHTPGGRELRRLERWSSGSAAYLIDRHGARIAIEGFKSLEHTADHTLYDIRNSPTARALRTVQVVPSMAQQRGNGVDSDLKAFRRQDRLRGSRFRRNVKSAPYKARLLALRALGLVRRVNVAYSEHPPP